LRAFDQGFESTSSSLGTEEMVGADRPHQPCPAHASGIHYHNGCDLNCSDARRRGRRCGGTPMRAPRCLGTAAMVTARLARRSWSGRSMVSDGGWSPCRRCGRQCDCQRIAAQHHKRYRPSDCPLRIRVHAEQFGNVADGRRLDLGLPSVLNCGLSRGSRERAPRGNTGDQRTQFPRIPPYHYGEIA
jgi:hypothetical protein